MLPRKLTLNGAANTNIWIIENQNKSTLRPSSTIEVGPIAPTFAASILRAYNISLSMLPTTNVKASVKDFILSLCS